MEKVLNTEILVSIIIPIYQAEGTLRECVLSCVTQKGIESGDYEIILVDDGSKDNSAEIADELAEEYGQDKIKGRTNLDLVRLLRRGQHYPVKFTFNNVRTVDQFVE